MADRKADNVRQLGLFADCRAADVNWVCGIADVVDAPAGRVLALEGETVREAVVLLDGIASAHGGDVLLGRGACHGAAEIVSGRRCSMTIEARTPVRLLVFGAREFRSLLSRIPSLQTRLVPAEPQPVETDLMLRAVS